MAAHMVSSLLISISFACESLLLGACRSLPGVRSCWHGALPRPLIAAKYVQLTNPDKSSGTAQVEGTEAAIECERLAWSSSHGSQAPCMDTKVLADWDPLSVLRTATAPSCWLAWGTGFGLLRHGRYFCTAGVAETVVIAVDGPHVSCVLGCMPAWTGREEPSSVASVRNQAQLLDILHQGRATCKAYPMFSTFRQILRSQPLAFC